MLSWMRQPGHDRKISDSHRKGYSCPLYEKFVLVATYECLMEKCSLPALSMGLFMMSPDINETFYSCQEIPSGGVRKPRTYEIVLSIFKNLPFSEFRPYFHIGGEFVNSSPRNSQRL